MTQTKKNTVILVILLFFLRDWMTYHIIIYYHKSTAMAVERFFLDQPSLLCALVWCVPIIVRRGLGGQTSTN